LTVGEWLGIGLVGAMVAGSGGGELAAAFVVCS
jgi:hypothetical protein